MARRLPCVLRRPFNLIHAPEADVVLESRCPGFLHGDPRPWAPAVLSAWEAAGAEAPMPYTPDCDLLLAPAPLPGHETESLLAQLRTMPASRPVALYERDRTVWPNLLLTVPASDDADAEVPPATAGLRIVCMSPSSRNSNRDQAAKSLNRTGWRRAPQVPARASKTPAQGVPQNPHFPSPVRFQSLSTYQLRPMSLPPHSWQ